MPELTASITASFTGDESTRARTAASQVTDYCAHAYIQEHRVSVGEDVTVWTTAGDPGYADFVLLRVEVIDWGGNDYLLPVQITSGSGSILAWILRPFDVLDLWSVDIWNEQSNGGSPDTIDSITILGSNLFVTAPSQVRITAYTVES